MQQQINLYKLIPKKPKSPITLKRVVMVYVAFMLLLILQLVNELWHEYKLRVTDQTEIKLLEQSKSQLMNLLKQYPNVDVKNIETIGENLKSELNNEMNILKLLANTSTFSRYMQGLGEATVDNVWLTHFYFAAHDPKILLKGNASRVMLAQQYLDQLSKQPVFSDVRFTLVNVATQKIEKKDIISFEMTTKVGTSS